MKKLAHVGICVHSVDAMIALLESTVGVTKTSIVDMPERGQKSAYVYVGETGFCLELMEPLGENGGTVADFLARRGEGLHHLSFRVDSVEETVADFEAQGCRIIGKGRGVAFVHPKTAYGVLYELTDATYGT